MPLENRIEINPDILGGEPVFRGTRIAVRHIGWLIHRNIPFSEIKQDYPNLTDEDFILAIKFVDKDHYEITDELRKLKDRIRHIEDHLGTIRDR